MFKKIRVKNVKNLENFSTELGEYNLITGGNRRGKTALMDAIGILVTGAHPTLGKQYDDIMKLLPANKDSLEIEGTLEDGRTIKRKFEKTKKGGNTQKVFIDGSPVGTTKANIKLSEILGEFAQRFNLKDIADMNVQDRQLLLFKMFADKLIHKTIKDIIFEMKFFIICKLEEAAGVLRYAYDMAEYDEIEEDSKEQFIEDVIAKLGDDKKIIINDVFHVISHEPAQDIQSFIINIVDAINKQKNLVNDELQSTKKALQKNRDKTTNEGPSVADSKKALKATQDKIKTIQDKIDAYNTASTALNDYNETLKALSKDSIPWDEEDVKTNLKKFPDQTEGIKKLQKQISQYISQDDFDKLEKSFNAKEKIKLLKNSNQKKEKEINSKKKTLKSERIKKTKHENKLERKAKELSELKEKGSNLTAVVESNKENLKKFKDGKCPLCNTPEEEMNHIDLDALRADVKTKKKKIAVLRKQYKEKEHAYKQLRERKFIKFETLTTAIGIAEQVITDNNNKIERHQANISKGFSPKKYETAKKSFKEKNDIIDNLASLEETQSKHDKYQNRSDDIAKTKKSNQKIEDRKSKLKKPKVIPITDEEQETLKALKEQEVVDQATLDQATEEKGFKRKGVKDYELEVSGLRKQKDFYKKVIEPAAKEYKASTIDSIMTPVEKEANRIYTQVYPDSVVFDVDKCGIEKKDIGYVSLQVMSGAEQVVLSAAIIAAMMSNAKEMPLKITTVEASEIDDDGLVETMKSIRSIPEIDNIFISTFTRKDIKPPKGWNHIIM